MWAFMPASANSDREDPLLGPVLEKRLPRLGERIGWAGHRVDRGEVDIGERDVEVAEEVGIGEEALGDMAVHVLGDLEVHAVEARHAVGCRKGRVDLLHPGDRLVDGGDRR